MILKTVSTSLKYRPIGLRLFKTIDSNTMRLNRIQQPQSQCPPYCRGHLD